MKPSAQELLDAIQAGDAELFGGLLKEFVNQCEMEDEEEDSGAEDSMAAGNKKVLIS